MKTTLVVTDQELIEDIRLTDKAETRYLKTVLFFFFWSVASLVLSNQQSFLFQLGMAIIPLLTYHFIYSMVIQPKLKYPKLSDVLTIVMERNGYSCHGTNMFFKDGKPWSYSYSQGPGVDSFELEVQPYIQSSR